MLKLLSTLYTLVTELRNYLFDLRLLPIYHSKLPVISVGNITAGGNAKTPVTVFLAREMQRKGRRPVILTRGYGGKISGPYLVKRSDSAQIVSDEALLLSEKCDAPVVIARKRVRGAKFIEEHALGDMIILDDGFQHRYLARTLDIVCISLSSIDAAVQFCEGELLPYGRFREDRDRALARASAVVFAAQGSAHHALGDERVRALIPPGKPILHALMKVVAVRGLSDETTLPPSEVFAFCSIANPVPFFSTLIQRGYSLAGAKEYPDHYNYNAADFAELCAAAGSIPLVCTEKDGVKIKALLGERDIRVFVLETSTKLEPKEAVEELIKAVLY